MQKTTAQRSAIKIVGISTRTNNLLEADPSTHKVAKMVKKYFHQGLAESIPNRKNPHTTYCVYTKYASDMNGDFTYLIGEEVTSFDSISAPFNSTNEPFEAITIPEQMYIKFTNGPAAMPDVCGDIWRNIWTMTPADLGGERSYVADFEIYDERARDHQNTVLDLYIGIKT